VDVLHDIGPDDRVQIRLHEIEHQVDIFVVLGLQDAQQGDDIGVAVELLQKDDLCDGTGTSR
jgi:hypothetical protein